jgi:hypothetical protein
MVHSSATEAYRRDSLFNKPLRTVRSVVADTACNQRIYNVSDSPRKAKNHRNVFSLRILIGVGTRNIRYR